MDEIRQDIKYAFRSLRRGGALIAIAVLSLGIGIGANTTIFSAVDVFMLRPLPYPDSDELFSVYTTNRERGWTQVSFSAPDFVDFRERSRTMSIAVGDAASFNLSEGDRPERLSGGRVSANFLEVLGVGPAVGRGFTPDEEVEGAADVAVISDGLWERRFGRDPGTVGSTVMVDGRPHTIVGVMPSGFWYYNPDLDILVPIAVGTDEPRSWHYLNILARLEPGFSRAQAQDEAERIADQLAAEYPETNAGNGAALVALHDDVFGEGFATGSLISSVAVLFLLLIACANVASLLLTHAAGREREVAVRTALGARRLRIVRQFLTEALILAAAGGILGVGLSVIGIRGLTSVMPAWFPRVDEIVLSPRALLFAGAVSILSAVLVGIAPAFHSTKTDMVAALKEGGRGGTAARGARLRKGMVVAEVSLALALLVTSALLVQAFVNVRLADRGFDESDVLAFRVALPQQEYPDTASAAAFHEELQRRLLSLPGVRSVGATSTLPLQGNNATLYSLPGEDITSDAQRKVTDFRDVMPGYFAAMDIPILRGRAIENSDRLGARRVIVINETLAERHWPGEDPIGRAIVFGSGPQEIVGVAADARTTGATLGDRPMVYIPALQAGDRSLGWVIEADVPLETLIEPVHAEVQAIDPHIPAYSIRPLAALIDESLGGDTIMAKIMAVVALIALALALAGVYGVMAYSVSQRRQEMGIRMALGAQKRDVVGMVMRQGTLLAVLGIVLGVGVAFGMARGLSFFLFGVSAFEPLVYTVVALALLGASIAATYFPARRAMKVDPIVALRAE